jgi:hypothetical protein
MGFKPRKSASKHTLQAGDTLKKIADKAKVSWKTLAKYNWGTDDGEAVGRALVEIVGCEAWPEDPKTHVFSGNESKNGTGQILIPEYWKKQYSLDKIHKIKLKRIVPAPNVSISKLDKWFIPKTEQCELEYLLDGAKQTADKLTLEVYGSNYCGCSDWNKGLGKFDKPHPDEPIYKQDLNKQAASNNKTYTLAEKWDGKTTAEKGYFSIRTEKEGSDGKKTEENRYINVAFSPYTVHMRYYKANGDKTARVDIKPFWPHFDETKTEPAVTAAIGATIKLKWTNAEQVDRGAVFIRDKNDQLVYFLRLKTDFLKKGAQEVEWDKKYREGAMDSLFKGQYNAEPDATKNKDAPYSYNVITLTRKPKAESLKASWEIKHTDKLKHGILKIFDGKDRIVFQSALKLDDHLKKGEHQFEWSGKYNQDVKNSIDGDTVIHEDMPYRLQIQAHTSCDEADGLALAAMHTEVRLYVHPQTLAPKDHLYDVWDAASSMQLSLAPLVPGDPPAEKDGTKWFRYKLAEAGFHPGPITDDAAADNAYKIALKEFKRSVPKDGSVGGTNFTRLTIDKNEDEDTRTAIKTLRASDRRRWFGDLQRIINNDDDPDLSDEDIKTKLTDKAQDVVIWADDRQYYTAGQGKDENNNNFLSGSTDAEAFGLKNYRGKMDIADDKTTRDTESIPRPWIPLSTEPRLVSRTKGLYDSIPLNITDEDRAAMLVAIGPLRMDWTFDELHPDISIINAGAYDRKYTRSRFYVWWALDQYKGKHIRKDTNREAVYTNSREDLGGIRPEHDVDLDKYYQRVFGHGKLSLNPWLANSVDANMSIATVYHDHMTTGQKKNMDLFSKALGRTGVFFNPSNIAGDGYRIRAEICFAKFTGYDFENLGSLDARYPVTPQVHSARLRIWRRSSMRGYMCWAGTATGNWTGLVNGFRDLYKASHVYFIHEGKLAQNFAVSDVFDPSDAGHVSRFKDIIHNNTSEAFLRDKTKITLKSDHIWPWSDRDDFGWPKISPVNLLTYSDLKKKWLNKVVFNKTWRSYRSALLLALVKEAEKRGRLRGHFFVEFKSSPAYFIEKYVCTNPTSHTYWYIEKTGAPSPPNGPCPAPGCGTGGYTLQATGTGKNRANGLPLPAVGIALGATWLFTSSNADTWAHEVGHHRHLEHAASAPGAQYAPRKVTDPVPNGELHDSQDNDTQNWGVLGETEASKMDWDRCCTMSYTKGGSRYFCGKCILRNRGWKVQSITYPGKSTAEPPP